MPQRGSDQLREAVPLIDKSENTNSDGVVNMPQLHVKQHDDSHLTAMLLLRGKCDTLPFHGGYIYTVLTYIETNYNAVIFFAHLLSYVPLEHVGLNAFVRGLNLLDPNFVPKRPDGNAV